MWLMCSYRCFLVARFWVQPEEDLGMGSSPQVVGQAYDQRSNWNINEDPIWLEHLPKHLPSGNLT